MNAEEVLDGEAKQGAQGDARVQGGDASLGQEGAEGDLAQAGDRDSALRAARGEPQDEAQAPKVSIREQWADVVAEVFDRDWLAEQARLASELQKGYRVEVTCKHCGRPSIATAYGPDVAGRLEQAIKLLEQSEGRPGTASTEAGDVTLVVERRWPLADDPHLHDVRPSEDPEPGGVSPL